MAAGMTQAVAGLVAAFLAGAGGALFWDGQALEIDAGPSETITASSPSHSTEPAAQAHAHEPASFDPDAGPSIKHTPPFDLETGNRPSVDEAKQFGKKYSRFIAKGNEGIDQLRAEGYLTGDGTPDSPYVLEDFYVSDELSITSINRSLIIREGYVHGALRLNYIGESLYVHHVYADDLRINENVKRSGPNTGGLFHDNHFAFVGQIRHFVGEFTKNEIGPRPAGAVAEYLGDAGVGQVAPEVVFNFDGFHTADVSHNHFLGQVDIKLHGHNHADCFVCPVHDHSNELEFPGAEHDQTPHDPAIGFDSRHSIRYVSLLFRDNVIEVPSGLALRYNDRNHAGDDRTANSEPNPRLDDPHVHYQDITIRGNKLVGGSMLIDVFNAQDDHHALQNHGILRLIDNDVTVHYYGSSATRAAPMLLSGIQVHTADGLELRALNNEVGFLRLGGDEPGAAVLGTLRGEPELRGFQLITAEHSNLTLADNVVRSGKFGVYAQTFTESVHWILRSNDFQTAEQWRGKDIQNPPEENP